MIRRLKEQELSLRDQIIDKETLKLMIQHETILEEEPTIDQTIEGDLILQETMLTTMTEEVLIERTIIDKEKDNWLHLQLNMQDRQTTHL